MPKKRRKFHATTVRVTGTKTRTQTLTENPTAEIQQVMLQSTLSRFEAAALPNTYIKVTADHSNHKKDAAATKEDNSHRKHPYTGSGTSTLAAAPLQQGAAPLSTFKQQYQGDAAFKELLQQKKIGQQHKSSTNQDCNHTSAD
jgi:hypothetical protein